MPTLTLQHKKYQKSDNKKQVPNVTLNLWEDESYAKVFSEGETMWYTVYSNFFFTLSSTVLPQDALEDVQQPFAVSWSSAISTV